MFLSIGKNTKVSFQKLSSWYSWNAVLYELNPVNTLTQVWRFIRQLVPFSERTITLPTMGKKEFNGI